MTSGLVASAKKASNVEAWTSAAGNSERNREYACWTWARGAGPMLSPIRVRVRELRFAFAVGIQI